MKRKRQILTVALLSASVGLGAQSILAQTAPGGGSTRPTDPTGPVVPQPGPSLPRETQPTIPGQPAPGIPQPDRMPGQPGTIPERVQRPSTGDQNMKVSSDDIKKAQDALKAKGLNPGTDGRMDAKTQQALRDFQKSSNLPATGVLDDRTAEKLGVKNDINSTPERGRSSTRPENSIPKSDSSLPQ
jgi:hypothetical protein